MADIPVVPVWKDCDIDLFKEYFDEWDTGTLFGNSSRTEIEDFLETLEDEDYIQK